MARVEAVTHVEAPPERVWAALVDWESQPAWMADAHWVRLLSEQREGVGTRLRCRTDIAFGLRVDDDMVITGWQPSEVMEVTHEGPVIRGVGAFELSPTAHGTRLEWWEEFSAPLGAPGELVAGLLVVPWLRPVFRRSLSALKRLVEGGRADS